MMWNDLIQSMSDPFELVSAKYTPNGCVK